MTAGMLKKRKFGNGAFRVLGFVLAPLMLLIAKPAETLEIIDSTGGQIYVEVGKGRLLRLDEAPATVFLADPKIADIQFRSTKLVYVVGNATGETSLYALDKRDRVLLNRKIIVGYDLEQLGKAIDQLVPNSGIKPTVINSTLVLDGVVESPAEAEAVRELAKTFVGPKASILNRIKVSMANQVSLKVTIAEVSRSITKEFGIELGLNGSDIGFNTFTLSSLQSAIDATVTKTIGGNSVNALIQALEAEGLATVLAEPSLTAVSGETASFLAGGEFPVAGEVKQTGENAETVSGRVTVEFKPFGVSLSFTPTVLDRGRISLKVRPEVSQLGTVEVVVDGEPSQTLTTRRTETTVELGDGQSLTIAGLLQRNTNMDVTRVPGLADIPILGALFRSDKFKRNETELLIVVTPYIVKPTNDRIALPTDGHQQPNDYDRIVWGGMYNGTDGAPSDRVAKSGGKRLVGSVGYQVE